MTIQTMFSKHVKGKSAILRVLLRDQNAQWQLVEQCRKTTKQKKPIYINLDIILWLKLMVSTCKDQTH